MAPADVLREHLLYTAWASGRLVDAAAGLAAEELGRDFGTSEHSVLGTLVHVFAADRIWLSRVTGEPLAAPISEADYHLSVLQNDWPRVHDGWNRWAAGLTDASAAAAISYRDMKGNPHTGAAWEIVLHLVNHGTHHRGQVSGFLRAMGHVPPVLDLIRYYRERQ
ncbi:MAG: DUF664 domain-containing protein [Acidobacteriota bacterium]|nr:DUF664 domain-containing protein [Acidobacteriota bacterium]